MRTIKICLMYEPGKAHLGSISQRAEEAMKLGVIQAMPVISVHKSHLGWSVNLGVADGDWPFWFGFYMGKDFSINNREIVLGVS